MLRRIVIGLGVFLLALLPTTGVVFGRVTGHAVSGEGALSDVGVSVVGQTTGPTGGLVVVALVIVVLVSVAGAVVWYARVIRETTDTPAVEKHEPAVPGGETVRPDERSDDEVVIELLESNGGRMKQGAIVDETEWSKSKVSMLLSEMEDDEQISKLRVGRENLISLPGEEPEAVGSPFEDS